MNRTLTLLAFSLFLFAFSFSSDACMTFVVGKKASATGYVIVGHNEDDWPPLKTFHGLVPARDWPAGSFLPATKGCNPHVPQVAHTLACYWGEVKFPYGDGNADTFLNEKGVLIVSDAGGETTERMDDPSLLTEGGVKFNLRRAVAERATSARDGVRILCEMVETYGYAPAARIYTVADRDEAWLVQVVHGRNYVAVRCPDDEVTVMPNLYTVYGLDGYRPEDIRVSPNLVSNARAKGFWDGTGAFDFAKAYQGSYATKDYPENVEQTFEHPNNTGRFRQAIRLLSGVEWPDGKPFPFSVKPKAGRLSADDLRSILTAHNGPLKDGKHVLQTWSICSSTTIESELCVFGATPRETEMRVALGRGCEKPYHAFRPFDGPLPAALDDSATAEERLRTHVLTEPVRAERQADGGWRFFRPGVKEPFAACAAPPEGTRLAVRTEPGSPFVFFDVAPDVKPSDRTVRRIDLPRLTLAPFAAKPKAMSNAGLTDVDGHAGALGFLAVAEPGTRRGVIAAWLTNERASGVVKSAFAADGRVVLDPFAEYGRMLVKGGAAVGTDTFVLGAFDDCRLGLEAYADAAAARAGTRLPPQIAGYTTWYPDRFGYSDRSKYARGCGAGDEASTKAFADEIARLNLTAYGFSFFQIDDQWQIGDELNGPARNFTATNPKGPYPNGFRPTTDYLAAHGIRTGLWWIPFGGVSQDPFWADKSNLFVRVASDVITRGADENHGGSPAQRRGAPYETVWGGTCLDLTKPEACAYVAELTHRMTYDWGMGYIKYDGMWTGYAADLAGSKSWKDDHFDNAVFADPTVPNIAAYRLGMKTMRTAAKPGTFLLGCNISQNARSIVASFGLVDAMRIGGDNGPIDMFPERYDKGPKAASNLYFLNGRLWYNDPDPVYVRNVVPLGRARTFASFTALAGALYNFSDWLPDLAPERVEILKRTMAPHGVRAARPIDYFETSLPTAWVVDGGRTKVFGLYNWKTNAAAHVDFPAAYAGLDPDKTYVGFDFWNDALVPAFKDRLTVDIPADDCRVIAVRELDKRPFVLSTSRHVASPLLDVTEERWDAVTKTLSGVSTVVPGERYELRIIREGRLVRRVFTPDRTPFAWHVVF